MPPDAPIRDREASLGVSVRLVPATSLQEVPRAVTRLPAQADLVFSRTRVPDGRNDA